MDRRKEGMGTFIMVSFDTHINCAQCCDKWSGNNPVCWEEKTALHVHFIHLTNTSNRFKDGQWLECTFCSQDSRCASCLKCSCSERRKFHVCCDSCTFCVLTGQPLKKGVTNPHTKKIQIKPVKDAAFVDLTPSAPPVTNVLSVVEDIPVWALTAKNLESLVSKGFESKGCFDIEGEIQSKIQDQTSSH